MCRGLLKYRRRIEHELFFETMYSLLCYSAQSGIKYSSGLFDDEKILWVISMVGTARPVPVYIDTFVARWCCNFI